MQWFRGLYQASSHNCHGFSPLTLITTIYLKTLPEPTSQHVLHNLSFHPSLAMLQDLDLSRSEMLST